MGPSDPLILMPNLPEGLLTLQRMGYLLIVVSNQSGIGRGLITRQDVDSVNAALAKQLGNFGVSIIGFYVCPHRPDAGCNCRKPKPGLLIKAAEDHSIDFQQSFMVGDRESDMQAAASVNMRGFMVCGQRTGPIGRNFKDLAEFAEFVRSSSEPNREGEPR